MANLQTYYQRDYSGGLNDTSSPRDIAPTQAAVLHDWDITYQGQLRRRDGLIQAGNTIGANPVLSLSSFQQSAGGKDLVLVEGGTLRYLNGTSWDALDTTLVQGNPFWLETITALDKLFIANQDNALRSWNRSSVITNTCLVSYPSAPHGNVLRWHKNHLFTLNNVQLGSNLYQHDLFWSALGDPTTWDTVNDHFSIPGNGRAIGCMDMGDHLILFKERAIQYLSGWGDQSWQVTANSSSVANLDEQVGCIAPRGMTRVGNECWFIDAQGYIRRIYQTDFDAFRHDIVSKNIQGTLSGLNKTNLSKAVAWSHANKVYFAIPTGTSAVNNLVLVFDILAANRSQGEAYSGLLGAEAWTTYTGWNVGTFASFPSSTTPDLYIGDATTGLVYKHAGVSDNGTAISARWDGPQTDFGQPERWKRFKFGYITGTATGSTQVGIYASVDTGSQAKLNALSLVVSGSRLGPTGSFLLGPTGNARLSGAVDAEGKYYFSQGGGAVRGKTLQMSLQHSALGEQPIINGHTVHYKERQLR